MNFDNVKQKKFDGRTRQCSEEIRKNNSGFGSKHVTRADKLPPFHGLSVVPDVSKHSHGMAF